MWKWNNCLILNPHSCTLSVHPLSMSPIAHCMEFFCLFVFLTCCFFIPVIESCPPLDYGSRLGEKPAEWRGVTSQSGQKNDAAQEVS